MKQSHVLLVLGVIAATVCVSIMLIGCEDLSNGGSNSNDTTTYSTHDPRLVGTWQTYSWVCGGDSLEDVFENYVFNSDGTGDYDLNMGYGWGGPWSLSWNTEEDSKINLSSEGGCSVCGGSSVNYTISGSTLTITYTGGTGSTCIHKLSKQ